MAVETRLELVGRRFLCVSGGEALEVGGVSSWHWRAGVIRAVTARDTESPTFSVCAEFDNERRGNWFRIWEEFGVFLLEQRLVWASRNTRTTAGNNGGSGHTGTSVSQGSKGKTSLHPALSFRTVVGEACLGSVSVVEFLSDRHLDFFTDHIDLQPYQDEVDSGNPSLQDDPLLREQIQAFLRQQKAQHILIYGECCLTGLKVKVYREDSEIQWLSGIITHHNQNSRTLTVKTEQESLSIDPSLVQIMFVDDVHSLLMGEHTSTRHRSRPKNNSNTSHPGSSGLTLQKPSQDSKCSTVEEVAEERMMEERNGGKEREERRSLPLQANTQDPPKSKNNYSERKRRKVGEEEEERDEKERKGIAAKRLKGTKLLGHSESSDSENTGCRIFEPSTDEGSKAEVKNHCASKHLGEVLPSPSADSDKQEMHPPDALSSSASCNGVSLECMMDCGRTRRERRDGVVEEMEDRNEGASREDSEAVSALLASQESEQLVSMETTCVLLHASSPECGGVEGEQETPVCDPEVKGSDFSDSEVIPAISQSEASAQKQEEQSGKLHWSPNVAPDPEDTGKCDKLSISNHEAELSADVTHKPWSRSSPCPSPEVEPQIEKELSRLKQNSSPEADRNKENASPSKALKDTSYSAPQITPSPKETRPLTPNRTPTPKECPLQTSTPVKTPTPTPSLTPTPTESTKSPLIIDRNEPFTVYRDPALVRAEPESHSSPRSIPAPLTKQLLNTSSTSPNTSNLTSAVSHPKLISPSNHPTHPSPIPLPSQPPICSLTAPPHPSIPHPHLLPSLLPALPPSASLLAGHPRLGPLGLPHHPLALQPGASLLAQAPGSAPLAPLGLYPLLWPPFTNGAHPYTGLGLQASKWTHSESSSISEASMRRRSPSPWLPQPTPVTCAEGQGLRSHLPVRPASADPERTAKGTPHASVPCSKTTEELERRVLSDTTQSSIPSPYKSEQERVRDSVGKNNHTQRPLIPDLASGRSKTTQAILDLTGDRSSRYQEENRRILQESIEVAPFTAKLGLDPQYSRTPSASLPPKDRERERERGRERERERDLHAPGQAVLPRSQSAHSSNYYTTLSNSVENEPLPRRFPPSKELYERLSSSNSAGSVSARPPPLVKRHPEKEEGLPGKISRQLALQATSVEPRDFNITERKGSSSSLISSSSSSRGMPSLHRAPIFHPPALPIQGPKEVGHGRLSPPTLTPVQPMGSPGKAQSQQRPPTLLPELRHAIAAGKRVVPEPTTMTTQAYDAQRHDTERGGAVYHQDKVIGWHTANGAIARPQSATASVIVRPTSYTHTLNNYPHNNRTLSVSHSDHGRTFENVSTLHSKEACVPYKKGVLWTPLDTVQPLNMTTTKSDHSTPVTMTTTHTLCRATECAAYSLPTVPTVGVGVHYPTHSKSDLVAEQHTEEGGATRLRTDLSATTCHSSRDLPNLKKQRAGLGATKSRLHTHTIHGLHTTHTTHIANTTQSKSGTHTQNSRYGTTIHNTRSVYPEFISYTEKHSGCHAIPPKCPRLGPVSQEATDPTPTKPVSLSKTQLLPPAQTSQPALSGQGNYHKLKKAWLTRHSEQDRGSGTSQTTGGVNTETTLSSTTTGSQATKQEVNGFEESWSSQEAQTCLDKKNTKTARKSNSEDRKSIQEEKKSRKDDSRSNLEEKKADLPDKKSNHEDKKCLLEDRESTNDKKDTSEDRKPNSVDSSQKEEVRGKKRAFESSSESESGGGSGNESENCEAEERNKRQSKTSLKKKQSDLHKKGEENEREEEQEDEEEGEEEEDGKVNGTFQNVKEKARLRLSSSNGIPRSVLKDWRKVRKLKQSGEAFLQDDSCAEIGPNVQKCRECRLDRTRKAQEPAISPVFCRFYYFRRLSYSKNGVVRVDGFSVLEQTDEEAVRVWMPGYEDEDEGKSKEMDLDTAKYVLTLIGDKFCQLVKTENTAVTWIRKDTQVMWKRAVRGVREMCDACEATLFNMHWACHKCGFVVCMDCYKARERKSAKDKELYAWVRCVKNQPHDLKNLMPTQIVPETVLAELQGSMHTLRNKFNILSHCLCAERNTHSTRTATTNGLSQVLEQEAEGQQSSPQGPDVDESNTKVKGTHYSTQLSQHRTHPQKKVKSEVDNVESLNRKSSSPEQGSTLRDLLTSTAGKLRLVSRDAGMAFAPVYNSTEQTSQTTRMPNILDDIIASVVENKIPASKMAKLELNQDMKSDEEAKAGLEVGKSGESPLDDPNTSAPHDWLGSYRLLWLKDYRHLGNQRLFSENWTQEQPVLVSGFQKGLTPSLWRPEAFSREFSGLHSDLYNCRDGSITNTRVKEFWDGFEDVTKRAKSARGDPAVYRLKDWPSGDEFMALMPSRYDDIMRCLPVPEYCDPEGRLNLASRLPSFFIRPDLGPRLCCAHGVTACPEQDFGTANLHVEISDTVSILVYVGIAKGNGALSKTGVLKLLEKEALDESVKKRLRDPSETPGALWHIFQSKDFHKIQEFLHTVSAERSEVDEESDSEWDRDADPLREGGWYLSPTLRQRLQQELGVESRTLVQFHGDAVIIPAGALHQVLNLHSCIQVNLDFVSPEHAHNSYYLTQELRSLKDQVNYEDKLQVKNIFYHSVKDAVAILMRCSEEIKQEEQEDKEEEGGRSLHSDSPPPKLPQGAF